MAKILITGGAGYIGNIISSVALQAGHKVRAVDILWFNSNIPLNHISNPNYEFIKGDISDPDVVDKTLADIDIVIHTAAVVGDPASKKFPELTRSINQDAAINLINKAGKAGVKGFIFFSTCSNYGINDGLATEDSALKPLSLYAETKVNVERYLMDKTKGLDWCICRLSTVYGASPRMRFDLTVNDFTLEAYLKKRLEIFLPYTFRPYIHVFDVANVVVNMAGNFDKVKNDVFNVGFEGGNYKKIEIAEAVKRFIPALKIETVDKGADRRDYQVDFGKLKRKFGINRTYTIEDGIKEVVNMLEMGLIDDPRDEKYYNTTPNIKR